MDLQALATTLRNQIKPNGTLTLIPALIPTKNFPVLLKLLSMPAGMVFTLTAADITVEGNTLFIKGKVVLYSQNNQGTLQLINTEEDVLETVFDSLLTQLSISRLSTLGLLPLNRLADPGIFPAVSFPDIKLSASSLTWTLNLTLASTDIAFPLIPAAGLSLSNFGFEISTYLNPVFGDRTTSFTVTGGFLIGKTNLQISLIVPVSSNTPLNQWSLIFSSDQTLAGGIYDILNLFPGVNVLGSMPSQITVLDKFGISNLQILFNPAAAKIYNVAVSISNPHPWEVVSGLTIQQLIIDMTFDLIQPKTKFTLNISGNFTLKMSSATAELYVNINMPFGADQWLLSFEADVDINNYNEFFSALPGLSGTPAPALPAEITIKEFNVNTLEIAYNPISKQISYINFDISTEASLKLFNILEIANPAIALNIENPFSSANRRISGLMSIELNLPSLPIDLTASKEDPEAGWTFKGSMAEGSSINIIELVKTFLKTLNITNLPAWLDKASLNFEDLSVTVYTPAPGAKDQNNEYAVTGTVSWAMNYQSFILPSLKATLEMKYIKGAAQGTLTVAAVLMGMTFKVGYKFGTPDTEVYLEWEGIVATYAHNSNTNTDTISIQFGVMSLGDIITHLIASFEPGFTLPAPWNILNSISLNGLSLIYTRNLNDPAKNSIVLTYTNTVSLGFLELNTITLTKNEKGVYLGFSGKFLGMTISGDDPTTAPLAGQGSDVRNMPAVPGMGSELFDLRFLGLGQHVAITNPGNITNIEEAITVMKGSFQDSNSQPNTIPVKANKTGSLYFNQNSQWLIGADFTVAKFYKLAVVFNDPELYGLRISIDPTAQSFGNLFFEILYKKISDSIGLYQINLQLPDQFRHLEFGSVSITLPNIGISIYTNGDFLLDFGFPASITDFSRSFGVEVFPFTGAGGFYFGLLSGATATNIPVTTCGIFKPVIAFGLGLQLGVGKNVNQGILKAGLSLTVAGIFQGVLAFFHGTPGLNAPDDIYYKLQGTFGIVGHIYGEINFSIISARLDIMAYAYISITIESYREIPISFEAGVSVSLRVTINLGLFKLHISLRFSAVIRASFVIGQNHIQDAGWNKCLPGNFSKLITAVPVILSWQPVIPDTIYHLNLYAVPQLTLSGDGPQYNLVFYTDTANSLPALSRGLLYWCISALLSHGRAGSPQSWLDVQNITALRLETLLCFFDTRADNIAPFNYANKQEHDIVSFLKTFFSIQITPAEASLQQELEASIFPVLPALSLQTDYKGNKSTPVDFSKKSMTGNTGYISDITNILRMLSTDPETQLTADYYGNICDDVTNPDYEPQQDLSMATFIFTDFIALIAKTILQDALDHMQDNGLEEIKVADLINAVITPAAITRIGGMSSRFLLYGLRLPAPPDAGSGIIQPLYTLTGQQFSLPQTLATGDAYSIIISKNVAWIELKNSTITINNEEIIRINDIRKTILAPVLQAGSPALMINYRDTPLAFTMGSPAVWQYPGDYFNGISEHPLIWTFPRNLTEVLAAHSGEDLPFSLLSITPDGNKNEIVHKRWATGIKISVQQISTGSLPDTPLAGNMYNLTGADDAGALLLQQLIVYINEKQKGNDSFIEEIQLLFQPDPTKDAGGGNISAANGALQIAIVQANLSTETNPSGTKQALVKTYNTLNTPGKFVELLWENSIVRSGGFYLYYRTVADGNGLPAQLFNEDGVGTLTLLITYNNMLSEPFVNNVITGDPIDTSKTNVYAQSNRINTRIATIPPGSVGYTVTRMNPGEYNPLALPPTEAENQVYLQQQFNLLGTLLPGISSYKNLLPAGPADTLDEEQLALLKAKKLLTDSSGNWNYNAIIPYYKYVQPAGTNPLYPNPYAAIGRTVPIVLNWQDMFGNTPMSNVPSLTLSATVRYTDPLVAISQWPSVSVYYLFGDNAGTPEIQLSFCFDKSRYAGESGKRNAAIDLQTYMKLSWQLFTAEDISLWYCSSIDGTANQPQGSRREIDLHALNTGFITPVISYLKNIPSLNADIIIYTVSSAVPAASIADYTDIFALTLSVTLQRNANIDPAFSSTPGIASAVTTAPPKSGESPCGTASNDPLSLTPFAQKFETTFANKPAAGILLKIATATNDIWVIRMDSTGAQGIKYTFNNDKVYFFSPIPLATNLVSFSSSNYPYVSEKPYPAGLPVTQHFNSIDLDNWGRLFLQAVDEFFAPGYAVPAFLLDNGNSIKQLLDQKKSIASAIEGTIDYIIEPEQNPASNIGNAQDKWKQSILISLSNAYRYTAVVQTPVEINSRWTGSNDQPPQAPYVPALYGSMKGADPSIPENTDTEYSLSNAKVPLANGPSWLTWLFEAKDLPDSSSFSFDDMHYAVSHIEHQQHPVTGIDDYLASSWLTFIIPIAASTGKVGKVTIPVPLRAYPTPPSILEQQSLYPVNNSITPVTMEEVRNWNYQYTYQNPSAAQDTTNIQIQFNLPANSNIFNRDNTEPTLDQALSQFMSVYHLIQADFNSSLLLMTAEDVSNKTPVFTTAQNAVAAFINIVTLVAKAWSTWNQVNPRIQISKVHKAGILPLSPFTLSYTITESAAVATDYLHINITPYISNKVMMMPVINIAGYSPELVPGKENTYAYKDADGRYLLYVNRNVNANRKVSMEQLDIMQIQNCWSGASITRNQFLIRKPDGNWLPTNPAFIYQTPWVRFYDKLLPLLNCNRLVNIATINSNKQKRSLQENIKALFTSLTVHVTEPQILIKFHTGYQYKMPGTTYDIQLPVLLLTAAPVTTHNNGADTAEMIADGMQRWYNAHLKENNQGQYNIDLTVFSPEDNRPVLQVSLYLLLSEILA
jgi:hypothetical protein